MRFIAATMSAVHVRHSMGHFVCLVFGVAQIGDTCFSLVLYNKIRERRKAACLYYYFETAWHLIRHHKCAATFVKLLAELNRWYALK